MYFFLTVVLVYLLDWCWLSKNCTWCSILPATASSEIIGTNSLCMVRYCCYPFVGQILFIVYCSMLSIFLLSWKFLSIGNMYQCNPTNTGVLDLFHYQTFGLEMVSLLDISKRLVTFWCICTTHHKMFKKLI